MIKNIIRFVDWFIPEAASIERHELPVWRNFVFTHLAGPLLSQPIAIYLYATDKSHGVACWTMVCLIWSFFLLPLVLMYTRSMAIAATASVQLLCVASLFGSFFYGGVNSPFLPWILVAVLLGFFYLSERPKFVALLLAVNISAFVSAWILFGFPQLVPADELTRVGWISVVSGCIYMAWMAIFYANIMSMRSELQRESERHEQTSKRLQSAKETAERISLAKSIFLARMSHELRTPLNAVIGYSEILLEDLPEGGDEPRRADLRRINDAGKHLLSLVTEVLDISKIERNATELKIETFDVAELITQAKATCDSLAKVKKNRLNLKLRPNLGLIQSDPVKFRQILLNLLSNSAKFTNNGEITIEASRVGDRDGERIEMSVSDSGIGMSDVEIARLFKRFSQASSDTERRFGGSGLGLSICASFCAAMGGQISVTSSVGKGSRFKVVLPAKLQSPPPEAEPPHGLAFAN